MDIRTKGTIYLILCSLIWGGSFLLIKISDETIPPFTFTMSRMAIGVIISNRRIKGSCGGLANMKDSKGHTVCDGCTNPSPDCAGEPLEAAE